MKSKITRIMGVTLALVLTFTVGAAFLPANTVDEAEAATLAWSQVGYPTGVGNTLVAADEDVGPVAISPNFATDNTVFAIVNDIVTAAAPVLYFSTNGGHSWVPTTTTLGAAGWVGVAISISPTYALDSTVFVAVQQRTAPASGGRVYRSTNSGASFGQLGVISMAANEVITGMDVSPDYDGTGVVVVSIANQFTAAYTTATMCVQVWGLGGTLSWTAYGPAVAASDCTAVAFSPNYTIDSSILAVTSDAGTGAPAMNTTDPYLRVITGGTWDGRISVTQVNSTGTNALVDYDITLLGATAIHDASLALPQDYNSTIATTMRAYVSIICGAVAATTGNVYRVTGTTVGTALATTTFTTAGILGLSNLQYRGTFAEGTLLGTVFDDPSAAAVQADVYRTTNPTSAVVNWYAVTGTVNKPSGALTAGGSVNMTGWVAMSTDYVNDSTVIVGTQGDDSAFGISTDGAVSFNETGLIDNGGAGGAGSENAPAQLGDVALSRDFANDSTMFLIGDNRTGVTYDTNVWVSTDGGTYWNRCFTFANTAAAGLSLIALSNEFATDSVAYIGDITGTNIFYSGNAGLTWSARTTTLAIRTVAAPDAATVYVGQDAGTGQCGKSTNSGWTWPAVLQQSTGCAASVMSLKVDGSTLLAGGNAGTVRRSDDGGTTWSKVATTIAGDIYLDFDDTTVYAAAGGTGQVYRSVDGGAWDTLTMAITAANDAYDADAANELILTADGSLYMGDPTAIVTADSSTVGKDAVWRCVNPTAAEPTPGTTFERMPGLTATDTHASLDVVSGSGNTLVVLEDPAGGTAYTLIWKYSDTLSAGIAPPKLVKPADGSTIATGLVTRFTIEAIPSVTAYTVWWSTDPTLDSAVTTAAISAPGVQTAAQTLTEGATIYWMARATAPFISPWSEVWTVSTQLTAAVNAPDLVSPGSAAGSTVDVLLEPVLNWSAFKYATGYELQLAKDADMTDFIADLSGANALGNTTSWKCTTKLAYSSTYFYRVRAIMGSATTYSDWSNVVGFTTMSKPVEPTPPIIIEPAPPAPVLPTPETPAYIWGIIAIGAVLVIVVIVLIVRTRRVP